MKKLVLSNGVVIRAYVGDGFDGSSHIYLDDPARGLGLEGQWGFPIPHKDLPKVIELLVWYEREEMKGRHLEGASWRKTFDKEYPALPSVSNPYQVVFYRGHLESHLKRCGCKPRS